jgi:hypothetical protein
MCLTSKMARKPSSQHRITAVITVPIDLRPPGCHCESAQTGRRLVTTARLPVIACNRPNGVHNAGFQELGSSADIVEEEPKEGTTNGKAELLMSMGQGHPSPSIRPKTAEPQNKQKAEDNPDNSLG